MPNGFLRLGQKRLALGTASLKASFSIPEEAAKWTLELYPVEEAYSILLNDLELSDMARYPNQLVGQVLDSEELPMDLLEHCVTVDGKERFIESMLLKLTKWNPKKQELQVQLRGGIGSESSRSIAYEVKAWCEWRGMIVEGSTKDEVVKKLKAHWQLDEPDIDVVWQLSKDRVFGAAKIHSGMLSQAETVEREDEAETANPIYDGKTIPEWLAALKTGKVKCGDVSVAFRKVRGNAKGMVSLLRHTLTERDSYLRFVTAFALGQIGAGAKEAISDLLALLVQDRNEQVRYNVAEALEKIGPGPEAIPSLVQALNDASPAVRRVVSVCLGKIGPEAAVAVDELIKALQDNQVCGYAAEGLGYIGVGSARAVPNLIKALEHGFWDFRRCAVVALSKIATPEARVGIELALKDCHKGVRNAAAKALRALENNVSK